MSDWEEGGGSAGGFNWKKAILWVLGILVVAGGITLVAAWDKVTSRCGWDEYTHVVKPGEMVSGIIMQYGYQAHEWRPVWEHNKGHVPKSPRHLKEGTELCIPEPPKRQ